ncbi:hypothetical protein Q4577_20775 [Marinovum sp. 2_MG-2023]|uniref:hypothetical protein n=1 Tax=unclassified Marinovum TaxID=2647166 RepID=UPI0026E1CD24|nr:MULTISPECIES: hypothetical protein [unclassified Marinovum]MDO6732467.1 hypothetical protein [Marinovum sp. 2_MG-2023]MDO6781784.1 hypothetical protein [Marinovum sp. 1_MG-2023]
MEYDYLVPIAETSSGSCHPPRYRSAFIQEPPKYPLTTAGAADELGISRRELFNTLARYAHVRGIVEKHGRKNLFYRENIEMIRALRRQSASDNSLNLKNSPRTAVNVEYERFVAELRKKRKGGRHA